MRPPIIRVIDSWDVLRRVAWRLRRGGPPVPPWSLRRRVGAASVSRHVEIGREVAADLEGILRRSGRQPASAGRVLEWGCGSGRVALELERWGDIDLYGCDIDGEAVEWLRGAVPDGERRFRVSTPEPPLPYDDGSFDVVYSVSVFTHLDERAQLAWLQELTRVLSPGGTMLLTTTGQLALERPYWEQMPVHTAERLAPRLGHLDELGFIFVSYREDDSPLPETHPGISGDYGICFQSEAWTRQHWGSVVDIVDFLPAAVGGYQDAVVAVRASNST